jgi:hypothetical protein
MAVIGTLSILTHSGKVLFDTGATTSVTPHLWIKVEHLC